jgi:hypothetical protein
MTVIFCFIWRRISESRICMYGVFKLMAISCMMIIVGCDIKCFYDE